MKMTNFPQFKEELKKAKKIVIVPHKNPDGDAIGSTLAIQHYLERKGIQSIIVSPNPFPKFLKWLPKANEIWIAEYNQSGTKNFFQNADLIFIMDFNHLGRVDNLQEYIHTSPAKKVLIDHHQMPEEFDFMYSDVTEPATCQMVYNLIEYLGDIDILNQDIAECIYTGLLTDTGSFRYRSTTSRTLQIAADLVKRGVDIPKINSKLFDVNTENRMKLLSKALHNMRILPELRTAIIHLDKQDLIDCKFEKGDTEGFVNYGLSVENIALSIFLKYDLQNDFIRMSFRSKGDFNVNLLAREYFSGGGHNNAAGGKSQHTIQETKEEIVKILEAKKDELQNTIF